MDLEKQMEVLKGRVEARLKGRASLVGLEEKVGLSKGHLSKILRGKRPLGAAQLRDIATALDVVAPRGEGDRREGTTLDELVEGCDGLVAIVAVGDVNEVERRTSELAAALAEAEGGRAAERERADELASRFCAQEAELLALRAELHRLTAEGAGLKAAVADGQRAVERAKELAQQMESQRDEARRRASAAEAATRLPRTGTPVQLQMERLGITTWQGYALHVERMNFELAAQLDQAKKSASTRGLLACTRSTPPTSCASATTTPSSVPSSRSASRRTFGRSSCRTSPKAPDPHDESNLRGATPLRSP